MKHRAPNPRARLQQVFARKDDDGNRLTIPVFGSGLNCAANIPDSWESLLGNIRNTLKIPLSVPEPASQLAKWEAYLRTLGREKDLPAYRAERRLQRQVQITLENRIVPDESSVFFQKILKLGFKDIFNLNFDMNLDRAGTKIRPRQKPEIGKHGSSLYRWFEITETEGSRPVRIWHPHGDTARFDSIRLGTRMYGLYIDELEKARKELMGYESIFRGRSNKIHDQVHSQTRAFIHKLDFPSWLGLMFHAPLVFIGTSLGLDEWPMWWALHERARYQNRMEFRHPTLFVTYAEDQSTLPDHLVGEPAMVETLVFKNKDEIWDAILGKGGF